MTVKRRVPLRKSINDIRRWAAEDTDDEWFIDAVGTSAASILSVQSFRPKRGIYRLRASRKRAILLTLRRDF